MRKRKLYQIKFSANRKGFKNFTITGCVLAETREQAITLATTLIENSTKELELYNVKLLSAMTLTTDFFLMSDLTESVTENNNNSN